MNKIFYITLFIVCFTTLVASTAFAAESVWVSADGARLKADRSSSSATLESLKMGSQLAVIAYENRWYNVTSPAGQTGWIYRGKVSKEPVETAAGEAEDSGDIFGELSGGNDIQANAADSSRSIRGLSPEAKAYAQNTHSPKACQDALDSVLALKTNPKEIEQFLKKGKIGEFAQ